MHFHMNFRINLLISQKVSWDFNWQWVESVNQSEENWYLKYIDSSDA